MQIPKENMESLPKQFVSAMRTLFDIMDDKHTGYVKLIDIENRWRDDRTKGLPRGVIESLRKVASDDGLLTFDKFCTGLKICLLRNQVENVSHARDMMENGISNDNARTQLKVQVNRPPSAPLLDSEDIQTRNKKWSVVPKPIENVITQQRTTSMPQLMPRKDCAVQETRLEGTVLAGTNQTHAVRSYGPPKPPRVEKGSSDKNIRTKTEEEIVNFENEPLVDKNMMFEDVLESQEQSRGSGDGRSAGEASAPAPARRAPRRREPRRHTLHNGIDYNLLKRMKQIEQEKDVLVQGLGAVEEAREWYLKQLTEVQDKMRYLGKMGAYVEPWSEAQQERLELLRARVFELNRQLGALASGWRRGPLSLHMNLALPAANSLHPAHAPDNHAALLRTQNRMLAEEVNKKNERINVLEREKSALIRELLVQRNRSKILDNFS
ncbi:Suppressor APC domain-containing protein 2 [Eumeta japonica]|uniref:Suppressor APC domain-containing protein 2 n=1 Tax=Eumeta variegata TaxID=151549 RepID=A0A4C1TBN3_EUMVA|nr:Suppressor APC domain-containing protein 2 [Eumeta japonica]